MMESKGCKAMNEGARAKRIERKMILRRHPYLVMAWACLLPVTAVGGGDVMSLGVGRGYDNGLLFQMVMNGHSMERVRDAVAADGFRFASSDSFMAMGTVDAPILFLGLFDPGDGLTAAERTAVESFVRRGGALIYLGDNDHFAVPNASVAGVFGLTYSADAAATSASSIPDSGHPIIDGPAGRVTVYDGSGNVPGFFGGIDQLGPYAHAVLRTATRTVVAVIERDVLQPGSGPVVFISEANGFFDAGLGTIHLGSNEVLMRNIFSFAARGSCAGHLDCADGVFCNGAEACLAGECVGGSFPCSGGLGCHEESGTCGPCLTDVQCDNGLHCDGIETCVEGICRPGSFPCTGGDGCDESTDSCGPCSDDGQCNNGLVCDGVEHCGQMGMCMPNEVPCPGECQRCDEEFGGCLWCVLDLDRDGFIGTADFAFFAGCFGACYDEEDLCATANFDASSDGCVGTGDFAAFSGCFGGSCGDCDNCSPPAADEGSMSASTLLGASVELIALRAPTSSDFADVLPASTDTFALGETLFVEVWASRTEAAHEGLAAVYTTLHYDSSRLAMMDMKVDQPFATFPGGLVNARAGQVQQLGGCALPGEGSVGLQPAWARVATIRLRARATGIADLRTGTAGTTYGVSVFGRFGNLDPSGVRFGDLRLLIRGPRPPVGDAAPIGPIRVIDRKKS